MRIGWLIAAEQLEEFPYTVQVSDRSCRTSGCVMRRVQDKE
jgi:hypothetical protein